MPRIDNISINSWRGFLSFTNPMEFSPGLNLLVGKNGSGKTSVLKMIVFAARNTPQTIPPPEQQGSSSGEVEFVSIKLQGDIPNIVNERHPNNLAEGVWKHASVLEDGIEYIPSLRQVAMNPLSTGLIPELRPDKLGTPNPDQPIDVSEEFKNAINNRVREELNKLKPDFLDVLAEDYKRGLVDFDKKLKVELTKIWLEDHKGREVSIDNLSSGEQQYLYFYSYLTRIQKVENKIILIDEPELHLHSTQIRRLCELIDNLAENNQVVIASHSSEVLQYFINKAHVILLDKDEVSNIGTVSELQEALNIIGMPIDPSVFTATWICAENNPNKQLTGNSSPTTPEVLEWVFGSGLNKRYWSFGYDPSIAGAHIEGVSQALSQEEHIDLKIIRDGDKAIRSFASYPTPGSLPVRDNIYHFPFWELENLFLAPELLGEVLDEGENQRLWEKINEESDALHSAVEKTIANNILREYSPDRHGIGTQGNTLGEAQEWQEKVSALNLDTGDLKTEFNKVVSGKDWRWVPGKEVLGILVNEVKETFWGKVNRLVDEGKFNSVILANTTIKEFVDSVNHLTGT